VRSVSRIHAHLSIVYVTYTIDERAYTREAEHTSYVYSLSGIVNTKQTPKRETQTHIDTLGIRAIPATLKHAIIYE